MVALITCCREPKLDSESYCGACRLQQLKILVKLENEQLSFTQFFFLVPCKGLSGANPLFKEIER